MSILGVGDDAVEMLPLDQPRHGPADDLDAGWADDVADEEDTHEMPCYLANSTARVSRTTVTLISPG